MLEQTINNSGCDEQTLSEGVSHVMRGYQSSDGVWKSRESASYPAAMNEALAEFLLQARQQGLQELASAGAQHQLREPQHAQPPINISFNFLPPQL